MTPDFAFKRRLVVRVCRDPEFCDTNACIRKCCSEDEYLYAGYGCNNLKPNESREFHNAFTNAVNQTNSFTFDTTKDYGVLIQFPCEVPYSAEYPELWEEQMSLTSNGHVFIQKNDISNMHCFDIIYNKFGNFAHFDLFFCDEYYVIDDHRSSNWWYAILIVNCVFLLMTFLIYAYLPNLQNLHGKTVMCYINSLLLAIIFTFITKWYGEVVFEQRSYTICKALAYVTLFFNLSIHLWLNVMCFDMWWTFRTLRENRIMKNRNKRFLLYCLYAWSISFLLLSLTIFADFTDVLPDYLKPKFNDFECVFMVTDNWDFVGDVIFGVGPQMILLTSNVVFFILTSKYYNKVKADIKNVITDPRSKPLHSNKKKFIINVKLFIVMGTLWICQVMFCQVY
ncbi:G-protein coupled receptor Mth2 [Solenopsis invicta]|uniref:G-protein coupled receptor Mth2 n=1 Tax=Solenopsis invicta TaxID=13686 RepID=UPI00193DF6A1|nr:G-protein coupled receptor Mth2 [Solenopsis invicta]